MYDEARADRAVQFISLLKHTKDPYRGKPFILEPWQEKIVRDVFGTVKEDGTRQYRTVYISVARKNGKSELAAAMALYMLSADGEGGAEVYSAAGDIPQAAIVFNVAYDMVNLTPALQKRCKLLESTKRILVRETGSKYQVLSAEHETKHGFNASAIIFDELHVQPNRSLWDVLTTSSGTRRQPLTVAITTAGWDRNSICWEVHDHARQVIDGTIEDPSFYAVIYAADEEDDWTDEAVWHKANPALGTFRSLDEMRDAFRRAQQTPAFENTFRRLYLNQWTKQESRYIGMDKWDACDGKRGNMEGRTVYGSLDLASTTDIAAFVCVARDEDYFDVWPWFFVPEENIEERVKKDRVPYDEWVRQGLITATPGNTIDYAWIRKRIDKVADVCVLQEIAYDRWGMAQLAPELQDEGFTVVPFGQGFASMAAPTKELLGLILGKKIRHDGHPVLRWMADNMVVKEDPAGNAKPDKSKSTERIDGMVALIMALDRCLRNTQDMRSVYEGEGLLIL